MRRRLWLGVVTTLALLLAGWVTAQMTPEEQALIDVYVRYMEVWETAEFDVLEDVLAPGFVRHSQWEGDVSGAEGVAETITGFLEMFGQGTTHDFVGGFAHGDRAFITGKITAAGAEEGFNYSALIRFENGLMAEQWAADDPLLVLDLLEASESAVAAEPPFPITFHADLSGDQMVPPVDTNASGTATAMLIGDLLVVTGNYQGLSSNVVNRGFLSQPGIVIHRAPAGENGTGVRTYGAQLIPGQRNLSMFGDGGTTGGFHGAFTLTPDQIDDLEAGLYYLAVHTETQMPGELRGQLLTTARLDLTPRDLVGVWEIQHLYSPPNYLQFDQDGTFFVGDSPETLETIQMRGVYQLDGHHLTFVTEATNVYCPGATGDYTVMLTTDGQLRFFPHADECSPRLEDLRGTFLLPVPQ